MGVSIQEKCSRQICASQSKLACGKRCTQKQGIDFSNTFALVIKFISIRVLLATTTLGWKHNNFGFVEESSASPIHKAHRYPIPFCEGIYLLQWSLVQDYCSMKEMVANTLTKAIPKG